MYLFVILCCILDLGIGIGVIVLVLVSECLDCVVMGVDIKVDVVVLVCYNVKKFVINNVDFL